MKGWWIGWAVGMTLSCTVAAFVVWPWWAEFALGFFGSLAPAFVGQFIQSRLTPAA